MRNRTELVTTTFPGSENDEDPSDLDDSEEDWKPSEKKKGGGPAKAATKTSPKAPAKRKSGGSAAKAGGGGGKKGGAKKAKKEESDEDDEEDVEDEEEEEMDEEDDDDEEGAGDGKSKKTELTKSLAECCRVVKPSRKGGSNNIKSFPDKDGKFELYLFKNDLAKDFRNDPKLCMWRRDGSSLLQKYIMTKDEENKEDVFFTASSVYSCWEEKRKNDFFQIKVQCIGDKKDGKVKVVDVEELARFAAEDRPKIETKPQDAPAAGGEDEEENPEDDEEEEDGEEDEVEEEE